MFSGIIESIGEVQSAIRIGANIQLEISCAFASELKADQSVAHNGVCLTVTSISGNNYKVDVIEESLNRSNLGTLKPGDKVNLERSLRLSDRIDGHIVQGHVDQTATLVSVASHNGSWVFQFKMRDTVQRHLIIEKGSIAVNGVSLTISALTDNAFEVSVIPFTFEHTNFKDLKPGEQVNVEFDILGKYVERMLAARTIAP